MYIISAKKQLYLYKAFGVGIYFWRQNLMSKVDPCT